MLVGTEYKIESDSMNITLFERKISKKTQNEYWVAVGYFATVRGVLWELANKELRETELKDITTIVKKQDEIYDLIAKVVKEK